MTGSLPRIAICGRPNVGKSSLFNCLAQRRRSLVHNRPGITRDTVEAPAAGMDCLLVDTAGLEDSKTAGVAKAARERALDAAAAADLVLLVVDARAGLLPGDRELARQLRRRVGSTPVVLVVNKSESSKLSAETEFHALGLEPIIATSATHGLGIPSLREEIAKAIAATEPDDEHGDEEATENRPPKPVRISLLGRPNAGKSTLANRIARSDRMIVSEAPGTTVDAVAIPFAHRHRSALLVDTAGVRRRTAIEDNVEELSSRTARDAIAEADVVLLVLDAQEGVAHQDQRLAKLIADAGKAVVVVLNKSDLLDAAERSSARRSAARLLPHLPRATIMLIAAAAPRFSAKRVVDAAFASLRRARMRFSAADATDALRTAVQAAVPPRRNGIRPRLSYAHQAGVEPPTVAVHGRNLHLLTETYQRYLANRLAGSLGITSAPLAIKLVESSSHRPRRA